MTGKTRFDAMRGAGLDDEYEPYAHTIPTAAEREQEAAFNERLMDAVRRLPTGPASPQKSRGWLDYEIEPSLADERRRRIDEHGVSSPVFDNDDRRGGARGIWIGIIIGTAFWSIVGGGALWMMSR